MRSVQTEFRKLAVAVLNLIGASEETISKANEIGLLQWAELLIFRPLEILNFGLLCYMIAAQICGYYRNCHCMSATWGGKGG